MSKIIKKIMNANQEYTVLGSWGSEWEAHEFITQAAYDQLTPAQKAEKVYMIKDSGTPSTVLTAGTGIDITNDVISADMSTAVYDNTTSGLIATNVQDAIDEVFQSVSNGKELLADAITDKGVQTSATDSFQTMATNISNIETWWTSQKIIDDFWKPYVRSDIFYTNDSLGTWTLDMQYNNIKYKTFAYYIWSGDTHNFVLEVFTDNWNISKTKISTTMWASGTSSSVFNHINFKAIWDVDRTKIWLASMDQTRYNSTLSRHTIYYFSVFWYIDVTTWLFVQSVNNNKIHTDFAKLSEVQDDFDYITTPSWLWLDREVLTESTNRYWIYIIYSTD